MDRSLMNGWNLSMDPMQNEIDNKLIDFQAVLSCLANGFANKGGVDSDDN